MILFLSKQIGERFMAVVKKIFNTNLLFNNDNHNDNNHKTFSKFCMLFIILCVKVHSGNSSSDSTSIHVISFTPVSRS